MATTALERLRELRREEEANGEDAWPLPSASCPAGVIGSAESPEMSQPAADVLDILACAGTPLLHTALVAALAARGYGKAAACKAVAGCQGRGWIEHNLTTGYILAGGDDDRPPPEPPLFSCARFPCISLHSSCMSPPFSQGGSRQNAINCHHGFGQ